MAGDPLVEPFLVPVREAKVANIDRLAVVVADLAVKGQRLLDGGDRLVGAP